MYFAVSSAGSNHQKPIDILSCDSFDVEEQAGEEWQARLRHNLRDTTPYSVRSDASSRLCHTTYP